MPGSYREAALAPGIAKWRAIVEIVVRTALKGIVTGVLLALARVAGETAPLLFTALGNQFWTHNLTEPIAAMPLQIFAYAISPYDDWHRQAWAGALVLLLLVLAINIGVRFFDAQPVPEAIMNPTMTPEEEKTMCTSSPRVEGRESGRRSDHRNPMRARRHATGRSSRQRRVAAPCCRRDRRAHKGRQVRIVLKLGLNFRARTGA